MNNRLVAPVGSPEIGEKFIVLAYGTEICIDNVIPYGGHCYKVEEEIPRMPEGNNLPSWIVIFHVVGQDRRYYRPLFEFLPNAGDRFPVCVRKR